MSKFLQKSSKISAAKTSFAVFNSIMKELYRICKNNSIVDIVAPHPRHDDFCQIQHTLDQ